MMRPAAIRSSQNKNCDLMRFENTNKKNFLFSIRRGDLSTKEVANIMDVSLRGEVTPSESLSPPPLSNEYRIASQRGRTFYET